MGIRRYRRTRPDGPVEPCHDGGAAECVNVSVGWYDMATLVRKKKFRETINISNPPFGIGDFRKLVSDIPSNHIPNIRKVRLGIILEIAWRGVDAGVTIIDPTEEFKREFLSLSLRVRPENLAVGYSIF